MSLRTVVIAAFALAISSLAYGQNKLTVGDAAPGLDIETWVKGEQTTLTQGNVYVVEFWATWCKPCRAAMPHLTRLQEEYGDAGLTIIGISYEEPDLVKDFVARQGDKMGYTVAVDRRESTKRAWMEPAQVKGIPASFIVDRKGRVMYIGNPHNPDFDTVLKKIMTGRYDPKLQAKAEPHIAAARRAAKVKNWSMAMRHFDDAIQLDKSIFAEVALEKFQTILVDMEDSEQAYAYARKLIADYSEDAEMLAWLAQKIASDPRIPEARRDKTVAMEAAQAAAMAAGPESPDGLAIRALVHYKTGEIDKAVQLQTKAYFLASPRRKAEFKRVLESYQGAQAKAQMSR